MEAERPETVEVVKTVQVSGSLAGQRALEILRVAFPALTSREIFKKCRSGAVSLSGGPCDPLQVPAVGDLLSVSLKIPLVRENKPVTAENLLVSTSAGPLFVVREDEDLLAVSKAAGCASHPALRHSGDTLIERVRLYLGVKAEDEFKPALANRLDIETSGLALVGKNHLSRRRLGFDLQKRRIGKKYLALVGGVPTEAEGEIAFPLDKKADSRALAAFPPGHPMLETRNQEALTRYRVLASSTLGPPASLVEVELLTGRTHQIRRHFSMIGHPVAFDRLYGDKDFCGELRRATSLDRMFLHAFSLTLPHPFTRNIIEITAPLPGELHEVLRELGLDLPNG